MSHTRGAHRATPALGLAPSTWRPLIGTWFARRPGRSRGRHAQPAPAPRRRKSAYAVAGVAALGLGGTLTWNGELPALAYVSDFAGLPAGPVGEGRANTAAEPQALQIPAVVWLADRVEAARAADLAAAQNRAAAQAKAAAAAAAQKAQAVAAAQADPRGVARTLAAERGWAGAEFSCLETLWTKESTWRYTATNPSSGAYGIPQSLPAEKMATAGADWQTNPATQIAWGLGYIKSAYGTPCNALNFHLGHNWY